MFPWCGSNGGAFIILVDTREQNGEYFKKVFDKAGIESDICTLPQSSGADYFISNTYGCAAIQRKDSMKEINGKPVSDKYVSAMEELRLGILPRLRDFCDNPVLLVEESHKFGENGSLYRKENKMLVETGLHASSYYGFLESVRMMGVDVVTVPATPDMLPTIWYLISMDGYLSREHYPKHAKHFDVRQQALGALCCVPGIGEKRAVAALEHASLAGIANATKVEGLTEKQTDKVQKMLRYHA